MTIVLGIGLQTASGQAPVITSHQDGDTVYYGAQVALECSGGYPPLTWSGPGSFNPSTGSQVTWTAPTSGTTATVTVTDVCGLSDSVTFNLSNIIFVDKDRAGDDGTTWVKAFKHLQDALAVAGSGCEIWVAEGTYKPDEDADHPDGTGSQVSTFTLVAGAAVYGGFVGNETTRNQRNWITHETILSGDVDEDSALDAQNSRHVVRCTSGTSTTVLDGFTVTMGFSDYWLADGGGIDLVNCSPTIANCLIKDNKAESDDGDGGGMHCLNASPTVTNCIFIDNIAGDDGGALCNKNGSNGTFTNCAFYSNETEGDEQDNGGSHGGAIFNTKGEGGGYIGSDPTFTNCIIAANLTRTGPGGGGDGGGAADNDSDTDGTWINCTFYGNTAQDDGGGLATRDGATSTVKNCIFWDNNAVDNGDELWHNTGTVTISYSDIEGCGGSGGSWDNNLGTDGGGNIDSDPGFFSTADLDGPDNRFLTIDDGLEIDVGSPCIDTGTNTGAPSGDATGRSRPIDGDGNATATVDMGAYEFEPIVEKGPYLIYPGETGTPNSTAQMTVLWQLKQTRTCTLEWGTTTSYGSSTQTTEYNSGTYGHQHKYTITGLTPATKYYYQVAGVGSGSFRTAPRSDATQAKFLAYGDTRSYPANHDSVCAQMVNTFTSDGDFQTFVLHVGDFVDDGQTESAWTNEFFPRNRSNIMALQANVPIMGCQGNHELETSSGYQEASFCDTLFAKYWPYIPNPTTSNDDWYAFDYGPVHVVVIHEYEKAQSEGDDALLATPLAAIKSDLQASRSAGKWNVLLFHAPGYSAGGGHGNNTYVKTQFGDDGTLHKYVDVAFAGHNHYYARCEIHGVQHVTAGRGGAPNHTPTAVPGNSTYPGIRRVDTSLHHCEITVDGDTLTLRAVRSNGTQIESIDIPRAKKFRVEMGSDDAEQRISDGTMYVTNSSDLEMVDDTQTNGYQTVGIRFQSVNIPQGADISKAYVRFTAKDAKSGTCNLTFYGQDVDDAGTFTTSAYNISSRTKTSTSQGWSPGAWTHRYIYDTPDISTVIEEIVGRPNWSSSNDLALIITGPDNHERRTFAYDGETASVPVLFIEY